MLEGGERHSASLKRINEIRVALGELEFMRKDSKVYTGEPGSVIFVADKARLKSDLKIELAQHEKKLKRT